MLGPASDWHRGQSLGTSATKATMHTTGTQEMPEGAAHGAALGHGLPGWLAAEVDPFVMATRVRVIEERLASAAGDAGLRYECARVMANYFERFLHEN
jgi:hypothetical protein